MQYDCMDTLGLADALKATVGDASLGHLRGSVTCVDFMRDHRRVERHRARFDLPHEISDAVLTNEYRWDVLEQPESRAQTVKATGRK